MKLEDNIFSAIRILDLSRVFSGPFATRHFAEYGAEVIKIEPPNGDDSRTYPPFINGWSGYFEILNHNKSSLFLDLKNEKDKYIFYKLCEQADVVVENFSPEVKKRLGVDYTALTVYNSQLIYASISGVSERVDRKYYDVIAQAESGLMSLNGTTEDMKVATSITDAFAGMKLAYAISSALYYREKTKKGCSLVVSMKGTAFDLLEQNLIETSVTHINPKKVGNMDSAIAPFGIFKTKDGAVVLAIGNERLWQTFISLFHEETQMQSNLFEGNISRVKHTPLLQKTIEHAFSSYTTDNLLSLLMGKSIPCGRVNTMMDVLHDTENYEEGLLQKIDIDGVGTVVVPTGGITFSHVQREKYKEAPKK